MEILSIDTTIENVKALHEGGYVWPLDIGIKAVRTGNYEIVKFFLEELSIAHFNNDDFTSSIAISEDIADLLYSYGIKLNKTPSILLGHAFDIYIRLDSLSGIKYLYNKGYSPDSVNFNTAICLHRHEICEYLYEIGCPTNDDTLSECIMANNVSILTKLIEDNIIIGSRSWNVALEYGNEEVRQLIHDNYDAECSNCKYCHNRIIRVIEELSEEHTNYTIWLSNYSLNQLSLAVRELDDLECTETEEEDEDELIEEIYVYRIISPRR